MKKFDIEKSDMNAEESEILRPKTRGDCKEGVRPCPWVSCRHHIYSEIDPNFTMDVDLNRLEETCILDIADSGSISLLEIADLMCAKREKIKQLEARGLRKLKYNSKAKQINDDFKDVNIAGGQLPSKSKR